MDLSEIQAAYYMVAATGVLVAAIYYVATLRTTQKNLKANLDTRQTQVFMQLVDKALSNWPLYNEILNKWSWKDYEDFMNKYGWVKNPEEAHKFVEVFVPYEQMGLLVRDKLISPTLVWHWTGGDITALWERYEPIVVGIRENVEKPPKGMMFEWFEDLYYAMKESRLEDHKVFDARLSERRARRMALGLNPIG